ncbi:hypothetical protein WPS_22820 [Vulcanimicrobium alpinum]|uniref:DUF2029 domain-containing protein n=1 Tax=Vulcanimicrobium alpinum TaxID=3016050 RepID=A0AAN1XX49_UNVUL|nr:glycosyltransferase 87 family protein [Vulcanimicrobium alpinum]BDE07006.1 hypothetical protein WPS_22820 [Vulcanimicrobium alpinum]
MLARGTAWFIAPTILVAMIVMTSLGGHETYLMGDFRAFYCAGQAVAAHANPYLEEPLRSCEAAAGPPAEPAFLRPVALPAPLPPYALLAFVPLSRLPFPIAAVIFELLMIGAMIGAVLLFARVTGASSVLLNLAFAAITATVTLYVGQPVPLVFLAIAASALLARQGRWIAAALCAAGASIEPHVALAAIVGMFVAFPRTRLPLAAAGAVLAGASAFAVGVPTTISYLRDVVPAHALANAYEWQFSLTSILTSLAVAPETAIRSGEFMFALMLVLGVAVAWRLCRITGDPAVMVIVPPAFAVFGGVHVHFQQLAIAFPAMLYVYQRFPNVRILAGTGMSLSMIPWNVLSTSILTGLSPLLVGVFARITLGQRRGLVLTCLSAVIALSLLFLALAGFGPPPAHFVVHVYPPSTLAENSWGAFSRATLARPSLLMQWLRLPTMVGLACGLLAIARSAFAASPVEQRTVAERIVAATA